MSLPFSEATVGVSNADARRLPLPGSDPRTGTVYAADSPRYRVLCLQPRFRFRKSPLVALNGEPALDITGTGGLAPLRFAIVGGRLPAGLELEAGTGLVRGVPQDRPGRYSVEVAVSTATGAVRGSLRVDLGVE